MDLVIIAILVSCVVAGLVALELHYRLRARTCIRCARHLRTPWRETPAPVGQRRWRCEMTFVNAHRRDQGLLADARARVVWLTRTNFAPVALGGTVRLATETEDRRRDGYVTASVVPPGGELHLSVEVTASGSPADLDHLLAGTVTLFYGLYTRHGLTAHQFTLILPVGVPTDQPQPVGHQGMEMQPVVTHLLTEQDDLADVLMRYAGPLATDTDVVVLAETAVAIAQGRYFSPAEVTPGFWADRLCAFFPLTGSLGTRYTLQALMDEHGTARVVFSALAGMIGKLAGISGLFYRLAGGQARLIDDLTGTLPPFDKFIVLGPKHSERLVADLAARTGLHVAIVDANDAHEACVLAASPGIDRRRLEQALRLNPHGNEAQQTPIVILRAGEQPLVAGVA